MKRGKFVMPATLWKRVFAYIIDVFIITLLIEAPFNTLLKKVIGDSSKKSFSELYSYLLLNPLSSNILLLTTLFIAVLSLLYWSVLEYKFGQTIGKMLLKICVVSEKGKLTFRQCIIRNIAKLSSILIIIDSIPLLKPINTQRYSERYIKTKVIDKMVI